MLNLLRIAFFLAGTLLVVLETIQARRQGGLKKGGHVALALIAGASILFIVFLWFNHANFPLNLDLMEGTVLQHFQRAVRFEAIYPEPTPEYVPLAYNPLYYVLAVPFAWAFGVNLFTLRLVAILGMVGSGLLLYRVVQQRTGSAWWGLMSAGIFAASYVVMDAYLDSAHADSWLLFSALLGSYLIDSNRSRAWNLAGVVLLVASFWFKQHGALFAIGGVLFLTWREGPRRSWLYWFVAVLLGPILYIFGGPWLFGSRFHYFTWEVPRRWSELSFGTLRRYAGFILRSYPILSVSAAWTAVWTAFKDRDKLSVWHFQFVFAALAGFMGTLDPGSSNNVYIPLATWFILLGTLGLHQLLLQFKAVQRYAIHLLALFASFAILLYVPTNVIASPRARESYADLVGMLRGLDGHVYAPSLGQLQNSYSFYPAAHWVALEDMIRGPGIDTANHPNTRRLLDPAIHPDGPAYILANYPLSVYWWIAFLEEYYVLDTDYGDRFEPLRVLPARWDHGWPRYLYRYAPTEAIAGGAGEP
jgi:hypothetical protein